MGREEDGQDVVGGAARRNRDGPTVKGCGGPRRPGSRQKTTLLDAILRVVAPKGTKILLVAPTGLEAKTIHRLVETDPKNGGFKRNAENQPGCDLPVIDETSMLDTSPMFALVKAIPPKAALLSVGDIDQLP